MKTLGQFLDEAKATYCGRCGTTHVPPSKGGTCPAVKEEVEELDETAKIVAHLQKRYGDNIRKSHVVSAANDFGVDASKLAKAVRKKLGKTMLDEADNGIRLAKVMHKGQHVANITTYRGRGGSWVSGAETPDGQNATKKYGIGLIDTKKEILKKIKQYHKENN